MIDEARTLELFGYTSDSLPRMSNKNICAVCDECRESRILNKRCYTDLCRACAHKTPEFRKKLSDAFKVRYSGKNNPRYGKKHTDETKKKMREAQRGEKNYGYGKHLSEDHRKKISDALKGKKLSEETRQKLSDAGKGRKHTSETKNKLSDALKGKNNPNYGKNLSGDKSPGWRGGISFEPYCHKFNEAFKESIREKFGRVCFLCPKTEVENGKKLSVHHVDYDKNCLCDDVKCEFVPLCIACHSKTNHNREYWQNLIIEKLKDSSQLLDQFSNK